MDFRYTLSMDIKQTRQILKLAARAGTILMKNGAEVYRVEDTIERICESCGIVDTQVFATPTGIHISLTPEHEEEPIATTVVRIHESTTNLKKIAEINQFSRTFTATDMTVEEGMEALDRIDKGSSYPLPLRLLAAAVVGAAFCAMFSGSWSAALCSAGVASVSLLLEVFLDRYDVNFFIKAMSCCAAASCLTAVLYGLGATAFFGSTIIGALMLFVPGAAITNSIRDLLTGDMLSGIARMTEAFITAIALATGAGVMVLLRLFGVHAAVEDTTLAALPLWIMVLFGLLASLGFAVLFNVPAKSIPLTALTGGFGWLAYLIVSTCFHGDLLATFTGACLVALCSILFARLDKNPMTTFVIPGIMPLVPGRGMYYTMYYLTHHNLSGGASMGLTTLSTAGSIALGLLVTGGIFMMLVAVHRKILA